METCHGSAMLSLNLSSGPGDDGYLPVVGREQEGLPTNTEERRRKEMIAVNPSSGPREEDNQTRLSLAAPEIPEAPEYPYPVSLGGCQGLYDLWVEFNISASATTQTKCDSVNKDSGLQTKTVLQSICARQARVECLILDHHVSI